ncbi:hypothetical protein PRZ48_015272 [Zasmidium cellare]|uniref:Uncharacterized protein n=1 Tax=Zasmidium cellare TaxID=395010 RepID=A0ABR0DWN1_ZASCE|nr:hypothetical protein PRZ48_015272 [Zasmidium cellare]
MAAYIDVPPRQLVSHPFASYSMGWFAKFPTQPAAANLQFGVINMSLIDDLSQALLCSADLSLEGPVMVTEKKWNGPDGWGGTHFCKDWDAVDAVMRAHGIPQTSLIRPPPDPDDAS